MVSLPREGLLLSNARRKKNLIFSPNEINSFSDTGRATARRFV